MAEKTKAQLIAELRSYQERQREFDLLVSENQRMTEVLKNSTTGINDNARIAKNLAAQLETQTVMNKWLTKVAMNLSEKI